MSKKLEGLFGLKLGEVFDETKFEVTKKEFLHGDYYIEIEWPPKPNLLFKDYAVRCSKDMVIEDISANTLSPIPFDEAKERLLINILDTAEPAVKKAKPKRTLIVILSFIFGLILAIPYTLYLDRRKS